MALAEGADHCGKCEMHTVGPSGVLLYTLSHGASLRSSAQVI